jgi:hypothetical protein
MLVVCQGTAGIAPTLRLRQEALNLSPTSLRMGRLRAF